MIQLVCTRLAQSAKGRQLLAGLLVIVLLVIYLSTSESDTPSMKGCTQYVETLRADGLLKGKESIPVFYNLFVGSSWDIPRVKAIVDRQLKHVRGHQQVFVGSIGARMEIADATTLLHCEKGNESVTLHDLWQYCRVNRDRKVIYLHSKGSYHASEQNEIINDFLTRGALSKECSNLPKTCNVCSSRMSPVPHPHTSGNMWLARCSYVAKLPDPHLFRGIMEEALSTQLKEGTQVTKERHLSCTGHGRYSMEHWIHSHPTVSPCDLYDGAYVWDYSPAPPRNFTPDLKPAPRYEAERYPRRMCMSGLSLTERLVEFRLLYDSMRPPDSWYGWKWYPPNS